MPYRGGVCGQLVPQLASDHGMTMLNRAEAELAMLGFPGSRAHIEATAGTSMPCSCQVSAQLQDSGLEPLGWGTPTPAPTQPLCWTPAPNSTKCCPAPWTPPTPGPTKSELGLASLFLRPPETPTPAFLHCLLDHPALGHDKSPSR